VPKLTEKKWLAIAARSFLSNGTTDGVVTISNTRDFRVKQKVIIRANILPPLNLEVKRVLSSTQLVVGPEGNIEAVADLSAYTTLLVSNIIALEQSRRNIEQKEHERAVYAEEPIIAKRVIPVDELGDYYNTDNPFPVKMADLNLTVEDLNVQLTHKDNYPDPGDEADSVRVGDGVHELGVNDDGSINVKTVDSSVPVIANVSAAVAGTEYSYTFPAGTREFRLRPRGQHSRIQYAYAMGASGATFMGVAPGVTLVQKDLLLLVPLTIYFQTNKDNQIIEIEHWS